MRYIAGRSLKRLPGYDRFPYDYVGAADERHRSRERAFEIWTKAAKPVANPSLLLEKDGRLKQDAVAGLLKSRNDRVVELLE